MILFARQQSLFSYWDLCIVLYCIVLCSAGDAAGLSYTAKNSHGAASRGGGGTDEEPNGGVSIDWVPFTVIFSQLPLIPMQSVISCLLSGVWLWWMIDVTLKNLHTSHREKKKGKGQLLFASVVFVRLLKELLALKTCIVVYCLINPYTAMLAHSETGQ